MWINFEFMTSVHNLISFETFQKEDKPFPAVQKKNKLGAAIPDPVPCNTAVDNLGGIIQLPVGSVHHHVPGPGFQQANEPQRTRVLQLRCSRSSVLKHFLSRYIKFLFGQ